LSNIELYNFYGFGMKVLGYDRAIDRFVRNLDLIVPHEAKILDVGCGTGAIGLSLARRFPKSTLLSTDIDQRFLRHIAQRTRKHGFNGRVSFGISDITLPDKVQYHDLTNASLPKGHFDIVSSGAVIGYSKDQNQTLRTLLGLVSPNGHFIGLEMNQHFFGKMTSAKYNYPINSLDDLRSVIESEGFDVETIPLSFRHFPANLTRVCLKAKRR